MPFIVSDLCSFCHSLREKAPSAQQRTRELELLSLQQGHSLPLYFRLWASILVSSLSSSYSPTEEGGKRLYGEIGEGRTERAFTQALINSHFRLLQIFPLNLPAIRELKCHFSTGWKKGHLPFSGQDQWVQKSA